QAAREPRDLGGQGSEELRVPDTGGRERPPRPELVRPFRHAGEGMGNAPAHEGEGDEGDEGGEDEATHGVDADLVRQEAPEGGGGGLAMRWWRAMPRPGAPKRRMTRSMRVGGPDTTRGDTASFNPSPRSQARRERSSANRARSARNDTKPKAPTTSTAESQMA